MRHVVHTVNVAGADPVFRGHFPGHPLLPGVMLIAFARDAVAQALGRRAHVRRIVRQRFMRPVLPDTVLTVECDIGTPGEDGWRVACRWKFADGSLAARADIVMV